MTTPPSDATDVEGLIECPRCDNRRVNCWVWVGNTEARSPVGHHHSHFEFYGRCPFCNRVREDAND